MKRWKGDNLSYFLRTSTIFRLAFTVMVFASVVIFSHHASAITFDVSGSSDAYYNSKWKAWKAAYDNLSKDKYGGNAGTCKTTRDVTTSNKTKPAGTEVGNVIGEGGTFDFYYGISGKDLRALIGTIHCDGVNGSKRGFECTIDGKTESARAGNSYYSKETVSLNCKRKTASSINNGVKPYNDRVCSGNGKLLLCQKAVRDSFDKCAPDDTDKPDGNCMYTELKKRLPTLGINDIPDDRLKEATEQATTEAEQNQQQLQQQLNPNQDASSGDTSVKNTCEVEGVGWLLCPISFFLGGMADAMYGLIDNFLEVDSAKVFGDGVGLSAYRNFLPLANIILAILFVLIIYSEATGNGFGALSNYSVKKLLPRLVIFAILVNVSWYLCAAAVDISNILGANMKGFFENVAGTFADQNKTANFAKGWGAAAADAAIGAGIFTGLSAASSAGTVAATALSILGVGLLVVLAILIIIWLILIIRQAGIIILSIISPIAIAMGMLPNTKKLFDKWLSSFMALLITWPVVAVIFGGSEIASSILDESAGSLKLWPAVGMKVAAMAVKVIPLIGTPFAILACLKAFGKAGEFISNGAMSGIRNTTGRYKKYAGQKAGTEWNRARTKNAQWALDHPNDRKFGSLADRVKRAQEKGKDEGRNSFGDGAKEVGKTLATNFDPRRLLFKAQSASYNRQQANAETKKALEDTLSARHEKLAAIEGTQQYRDRQALNESELSLGLSKAVSEGIKQASIASDAHLADLNNQRLAAETGTSGWKHQQNVNYANAIKTDAKLAGTAGNGDENLARGMADLTLQKENDEQAKGFELSYKQFDLDELSSMMHNSTTKNDAQARGAVNAAMSKAALDNEKKAELLAQLLTSNSAAVQKAAMDTIMSNKELQSSFPELAAAATEASRNTGFAESLRGRSDDTRDESGKLVSTREYLMSTAAAQSRIHSTSTADLAKISRSSRRVMDPSMNQMVAQRIQSDSRVSAGLSMADERYNNTINPQTPGAN